MQPLLTNGHDSKHNGETPVVKECVAHGYGGFVIASACAQVCSFPMPRGKLVSLNKSRPRLPWTSPVLPSTSLVHPPRNPSPILPTPCTLTCALVVLGGKGAEMGSTGEAVEAQEKGRRTEGGGRGGIGLGAGWRVV